MESLLNITPPPHLQTTDAEPEPEPGYSEPPLSLPHSDINAQGTPAKKGAQNYDASEIIEKPDVAVPTADAEEAGSVEDPAPDDPDNLSIKPIVDDIDIFKDAKPKRKRKPPSEKQLAHLAKARATASAKKKERDALKAGKQVKQAVKKSDPRPEPETKESLVLHLTRDELKKYTEDAIEGYDTKRKARKQVKKKAQQEYAKANQVNNTIARALKQPHPDDIWADCFT